jgi:SAM-dependent methyltransferase
MDEFQEANRAMWDELVPIHVRAYGGVERFRAGQSTLRSIELEEMGEVSGKRLLHLQCHFGLDTLSWARQGADVVGADFSPRATEMARRLASEAGIPAEFVCSDVYTLPERVSGPFDVVFTSYGVLCWLPDLTRWADVIGRLLAPGGFFYIVEQHPVGGIFAERDGQLVAAHSYFDVGPIEETKDGSYADRSAVLRNRTSYEWQHPLSDIVDALTGAGLRIDFLHEFPFCMFPWLPSMVEGEDGWYRVPGHEGVPFLFSLKASKP